MDPHWRVPLAPIWMQVSDGRGCRECEVVGAQGQGPRETRGCVSAWGVAGPPAQPSSETGRAGFVQTRPSPNATTERGWPVREPSPQPGVCALVWLSLRGAVPFLRGHDDGCCFRGSQHLGTFRLLPGEGLSDGYERLQPADHAHVQEPADDEAGEAEQQQLPAAAGAPGDGAQCGQSRSGPAPHAGPCARTVAALSFK